MTASEVCGRAALYEAYHVKKSEVHGMAQRGGSVESHLRFGKKVFSPLIPKGEADYLVPFFKAERQRMSYFLKSKGIDLVDALTNAGKAVQDKRFHNIYLVGILSSYLPIKEENWIKAIEAVFSGKRLQENRDIFFKARAVA